MSWSQSIIRVKPSTAEKVQAVDPRFVSDQLYNVSKIFVEFCYKFLFYPKLYQPAVIQEELITDFTTQTS